MSTKPTLILIPGGWHTSAVWDKVTRLLEAQAYTCIGINLPSCSANPSATFKDDIQAVRTAILSETTEENHNVVLVAWSYGGQVGNSAIKGLTSPSTNRKTALDPTQPEEENRDKEEEPPQGRVLGLALIASGFTATGVSFLAATNNIPPPFITLNPTTGFAELSAGVDAKELFYHDLPTPEALSWESRLTNLSLRALTEGGESAYAGWKDVPVWFLITVGDRALPAEVQREFVRGAREEGADICVREVEGGHAVMLSREGDVAGFVSEAAEAFVR